jgi:hypothetical protein
MAIARGRRQRQHGLASLYQPALSKGAKGNRNMPPSLVSAYRATDYVAFGNDRAFSVRFGHHSLAVDGLLARMRAGSGVFITASNPFSKRRSVRANAYWDRELNSYLSARGFAFLVGEGRGEIGEWPPEASVLAFGISRARATYIGAHFADGERRFHAMVSRHFARS